VADSPFPAVAIVADRPVLAVARDAAFSFYYEDNLDLLRSYGANIAYFSPLSDTELPPNSRGVYLGGGFPELFAERLAANRPLLAEIRSVARQGMPTYAECGGLMYLAASLTDFDGQSHAMAGVLPCAVAMLRRRSALGYVSVRTRRATLLSPPGRELRGHEHHWSTVTSGAQRANAYDLLGPSTRVEGFAQGQTLASYIHIHFASDPTAVGRFVTSL
jgi:cobyrinic acid a,c-diamide synthase